MDFKKLLGDDVVKQLDEAKLTDGVIKVLDGANLMVKDENLVPRDQYVPKSVLKEEKEKLQAQIDERDTDLTELKKKLGDSEEAQEAIKTLQTKNKQQTADYEKALVDVRKKAFAHVQLVKALGANSHYADLLVPQMNLEVITEMEPDKQYGGVAEQIEAFKTGDYKGLFAAKRVEGDPPNNGNPPSGGKLKFKDLTLTQRAVYRKGDPAAFLKSEANPDSSVEFNFGQFAS